MIRLKDNFQRGYPLSLISADWLNTVARWLNSLTVDRGMRTADPYTLTLYGGGVSTVTADIMFSFLTASNGDNTATMEPGDVRFGPDTLVPWASFTGESTTVTVTASNTTWYVWLVIDVADETVEWKEGASITALSGEELNTKINWPLVKITASWTEGEAPEGTITEVKHLHLGDVVVSRAAG
jgi:hypothetical protein